MLKFIWEKREKNLAWLVEEINKFKGIVAVKERHTVRIKCDGLPCEFIYKCWGTLLVEDEHRGNFDGRVRRVVMPIAYKIKCENVLEIMKNIQRKG